MRAWLGHLQWADAKQTPKLTARDRLWPADTKSIVHGRGDRLRQGYAQQADAFFPLAASSSVMVV
jgi:hypothetical protein